LFSDGESRFFTTFNNNNITDESSSSRYHRGDDVLRGVVPHGANTRPDAHYITLFYIILIPQIALPSGRKWVLCDATPLSFTRDVSIVFVVGVQVWLVCCRSTPLGGGDHSTISALLRRQVSVSVESHVSLAPSRRPNGYG